MEAVLAGGQAWEEVVITRHLFGRARVAPGKGPLVDRTWTVAEGLRQLVEAPSGSAVYQLTLQAPPSLYEAFHLDPGFIGISDNRPDLVTIEEREGRRVFRVIDIKRGAALRLPYRVQVLLYSLELAHVLEAHGIPGEVDLATGAAWLGGTDAPTPFELDTMKPHLRALLDRLPDLFRAPAEGVDWHLRYRCEWCEYLDFCRKDMVDRDDVSRLVGLTAHGKRFLAHELGVRSVPGLRVALASEGFDDRVACCASLAGERPRLDARARAFGEGVPQSFETLHAALPAGENVAVFVTVQTEPVEDRVWAVGLLLHAREELRKDLFGQEGPSRPAISLAATREDEAGMRGRFILRLYEVLLQVDRYNRKRPEWRDKLSLQVYCYADQERAALVGILLDTLPDPDLAPAAMALLFHFQAVDLLRADDHPREMLPFPLIPLVSAVGRLLALPVDVSYTLPEVLDALGSDFAYRRGRFQFPFGHGLKADLVFQAWNGAGVDLTPLKKELASRLYAYRALLQKLREHAGTQLFAWPPKHALQSSGGYREPLLSRLAFLARYESLLACLAVREGRFEGRALAQTRGALISMRHEGGGRFLVTAEGISVEASDYTRWLVVRDTDRGRIAQARFNDWGHRRAFRFSDRSADPDVGIGAVDGVDEDPLGFAHHVHVRWDRAHNPPLEKGAAVLLLPRFMDVNADRLVGQLEAMDAGPGSLFLDLLRDPAAAATDLSVPPVLARRLEALRPRLGLTPSQVHAWQTVLGRRVTAIWGPPGTGKTRFLASVILALMQGQSLGRCRVLVSAMTHAAIENLLSKLCSLGHETRLPMGSLGKVGGWKTGIPAPAGVETVDKGALDAWLEAFPTVVVGSTAWGLARSTTPFDLVVIDEASQLKVPEAALAVARVAPGGRLVVAGDHEQLGPILAGSYPDPPEGEPVLHGSIFDLVRSRPGRPGAPVCLLLENFRMNDVLTEASRILYGPGFTCATPEVRDRRLAMPRRTRSTTPLARFCLDPAFPLVFAILDGVLATRSNPAEAGLVADLVTAWRDAVSRVSDAVFWRDRAFVVSPHHDQIRAIRVALAARRTWTHPPFVDTVDKMQGQEADVVFISYGVADPELAAMEAEFIYSRNRLNVAITRARCKSIVFLPRPLVDASPEVLDQEAVAVGLAYMRGLLHLAREKGETELFEVGGGVSVEGVRLG